MAKTDSKTPAGTGGETDAEASGVTPLPRGVHHEAFDDSWKAEYSEITHNGLWQVSLFRNDTPEWRGEDFDSLEDARLAARDYYDQL